MSTTKSKLDLLEDAIEVLEMHLKGKEFVSRRTPGALSVAEQWNKLKKLWEVINLQVRLKLKARRRHEASNHEAELEYNKRLTFLYNQALKLLTELYKPSFGLQASLWALFFNAKTMNRLRPEERFRVGMIGAVLGSALTAAAGYFLAYGLVATFGASLAVALFSYYFTAHSVAVFQAYRMTSRELQNVLKETLREEGLEVQPEASKGYMPLRDAFSMKLDMKLKYNGSSARHEDSLKDENYYEEKRRKHFGM